MTYIMININLEHWCNSRASSKHSKCSYLAWLILKTTLIFKKKPEIRAGFKMNIQDQVHITHTHTHWNEKITKATQGGKPTSE